MYFGTQELKEAQDETQVSHRVVRCVREEGRTHAAAEDLFLPLRETEASWSPLPWPPWR